MKKTLIIVFCLLLLTVVGSPVLAQGIEADMMVDPAGYMQFTLPEGVSVEPGQSYDEYILMWDELAGVQEYHIGVLRVLTGEREREEALDLANGWYGAADIETISGKTYSVPFTIQEGLVISGDSTEVNLGDLITSLGPAPDASTTLRVKGHYCFVMVVNEDDAPVTQLVKLP